MQAIRVDSRLLTWVTYFPDQRRLQLQFRSGEVYDYSEVPPEICRELLASESKGGYFNRHIRNRFPTQQRKTPIAT